MFIEEKRREDSELKKLASVISLSVSAGFGSKKAHSVLRDLLESEEERKDREVSPKELNLL